MALVVSVRVNKKTNCAILQITILSGFCILIIHNTLKPELIMKPEWRGKNMRRVLNTDADRFKEARLQFNALNLLREVKMKHIITLIFLWTLLSCTGRQNAHCIKDNSNQELQTSDSRCDIIMEKAYKKGTDTGVCYRGPLFKGRDPEAIDPDPKACDALYEEAQKKCDALPYDPKYIETLSRTSIYKGGKKIAQDGKPVCP